MRLHEISNNKVISGHLIKTQTIVSITNSQIFYIRKTSLLFMCFYKFNGVSGAGSMHLLRDNYRGQVFRTPCISMSL